MVGLRRTSTSYGAWDSAPRLRRRLVSRPAVAADWAPYRYGYWARRRPLGLDLGRRRALGLRAVPLRSLGVHRRALGLVLRAAFVARPVWAPALVGWVGGAGWACRSPSAAPVYGWVPLGWGDAVRPVVGPRRLRQRCWTHYNRPYAVPYAVDRAERPTRRRSPIRTARVPGAVTAVAGATLAAQRPVAIEPRCSPGRGAARAGDGQSAAGEAAAPARDAPDDRRAGRRHRRSIPARGRGIRSTPPVTSVAPVARRGRSGAPSRRRPCARRNPAGTGGAGRARLRSRRRPRPGPRWPRAGARLDGSRHRVATHVGAAVVHRARRNRLGAPDSARPSSAGSAAAPPLQPRYRAADTVVSVPASRRRRATAAAAPTAVRRRPRAATRRPSRRIRAAHRRR